MDFMGADYHKEMKMSELATLIENLKSRSAQIEQAIAQSLANHNALLGQSSEVKFLLDMATKVVDVAMPTSPITAGINVIDEIVDSMHGTSQPS